MTLFSASFSQKVGDVRCVQYGYGVYMLHEWRTSLYSTFLAKREREDEGDGKLGY